MPAMYTSHQPDLGRGALQPVELGPNLNYLHSLWNGGSQPLKIILKQHFKLTTFIPHFDLQPNRALGFSSNQGSQVSFSGYPNQLTQTQPGKGVQILPALPLGAICTFV